MGIPQEMRANGRKLGLSEREIRSKIANATWFSRGPLCKQIKTLSFFVGENYLYA